MQAALEGQDPVHGRALAVVLYGAILASAVVITLQSLPNLPKSLGNTLLWTELVLLIVFATEYLARLWSAPSRWRYALSFWGLIDLAAILPALLFLLPDMQALRTLRLLRVFRLLKLLRMRRALIRLENALHQSRDELMLFSFLAVIVLFLSGVGIYHFEKNAQPEVFGSIPEALWWAVATLTTVGYGDVYPITAAGRAFTALVLLVGLGIVAIPAGIITSALLSAPEPKNDPTNPTKGDDP